MVRLLRYLAIAVLLALIVTGLLYWKGTRLAPLPPATVDFAALAAPDRAALVARGAEVARDADCVACHLDPEGGSELGGGYPMHLPMGTLYGTNISPSREHGIGEWSADDLYRAVAWGVAPGGRNLYPAMPYVSYHAITRADSDALYAWLMAQRPVEKPSRRPDLMFPFNVRPALSLWNALFRPDAQPFAPAEGEAPDRARGRYLVDVLGHCGECHTPRNLAFAMTEPALGGQVLEGAYAPDLQQNSMVRRGWNPDDLIAFLHRGVSPQGLPTLTMLPVLQHSTSHMDDASLTAISTYLLGGQGRAAAALPAAVSPDPAGRLHYLGLCAGCHGTNGQGQPHSSVPLATNTTAMMDDPLNLVRVIREGIAPQELAHGERMQRMPGYAAQLSDQQLAELVNYLRQQWGGRSEVLTAADMQKLIKAGPAH